MFRRIFDPGRSMQVYVANGVPEIVGCGGKYHNLRGEAFAAETEPLTKPSYFTDNKLFRPFVNFIRKRHASHRTFNFSLQPANKALTPTCQQAEPFKTEPMKLFFVSILAFILCAPAQAQIITTVAGNGDSGYSGDGTQATVTSLNFPYDVIADAAGNLYIADAENNRVRKVDAAGIITTIAGSGVQGYAGDNGPATDAQLNYPAALAFDASGNLYIADNYNNAIRRVSTAGLITTVAGTGVVGYNGDNIPATNAQIYQPHGLAIDPAGNIYFSDTWNHRIRKIDPFGIITTFAGIGEAGYNGDDIAATSAKLNAPFHINFDNAGNLFVADVYNYRIRKVTSSGIISTVAGNGSSGYSSDGAVASNSKISRPFGIAVDASGNIFMADTDNHRVRKVNTLGIISTLAGTGLNGSSGDNGPATNAELNTPTSVNFDYNGNLYVTEFGGQKVRRIASSLIAATTAPPLLSFEVFPNPNNGKFSILLQCETGSNPLATIHTITGQKVSEFQLSNGMTLDMFIDVPSGLYLLTVSTSAGNETKKVMIFR